jgi:dihydrofolate reductase
VSRTVYLTATTLDGFIADPEHSLDWLFVVDAGDHEGDHARFMEGVGAMVMGASTYEWVVDHEDGRWPYEQPTWVMTHRDLPTVDGDVRVAVADDDAALVAVHDEMLEVADGKDVWVVGGGELAARLVDVGRLDEIEVSIAPVTLGAGRRYRVGR